MYMASVFQVLLEARPTFINVHLRNGSLFY